MGNDLYDKIGVGYRDLRKPDERIAAAIAAALGDAQSVLNVGAGAGSYEPVLPTVLAVEPAMTMIAQRSPGLAAAVRGAGERLPVRDSSFDACLAVLTLHHWPDLSAGLLELRRAALKRVVILTWDPAGPEFWLDHYFPEIRQIDNQIFPSMDLFREVFDGAEITAVPIPGDCTDGFLCAYWKRPQRYLDDTTRSAISTFTKISELDSGLAHLRGDLESGVWDQRYGSLLGQDEIDLGYRLVVAEL